MLKIYNRKGIEIDYSNFNEIQKEKLADLLYNAQHEEIEARAVMNGNNMDAVIKDLSKGFYFVEDQNNKFVYNLQDTSKVSFSTHISLATTKPQDNNNIVNEPSANYGNNGTLALNKTQDGQEFLSLSEPGTEYSNSAQLNLFGQGNTSSDNNNRRCVCSVWTKYKNIQVKRTNDIKKLNA